MIARRLRSSDRSVWLSGAMTQVIRCLRYLDQFLSRRANRRAS